MLFFFNFLLRVESERNETIIFIFSLFSVFQFVLALNAAIMVFFNFLNFFAIFWNFLLHIGFERNGTIIFIFSISQPFPTYVGLKWRHNGVFFFILFIFLLFFWKFSITRRVVTKRNDNFYFLSFPTFSNLFWLKMKP